MLGSMEKLKEDKCKHCNLENYCIHYEIKKCRAPGHKLGFELKDKYKCKEQDDCVYGDLCKPNEEMYECQHGFFSSFKQKKLRRYEVIAKENV